MQLYIMRNAVGIKKIIKSESMENKSVKKQKSVFNHPERRNKISLHIFNIVRSVPFGICTTVILSSQPRKL